MSKVVKAVKKVFKKIVKVVKKIIVPVIAVAAVVFTAGAALGAFAPTAAIGSALKAGAGAVFKGIGSAAKAIWSGAKAVFTKVSEAVSSAFTATKNALGFGAETAATATTSSAGTLSVGAGDVVGMGGAAGAAGDVAAAQAAGFSVTGGEVASTSLLSKAAGAWKGASTFEKIMMAKMGVDLVGGYLNPPPDPEELAIEGKKYRGAFYGRDAQTGEGPGSYVPYTALPDATPAPAAPQPIGRQDLIPGGGQERRPLVAQAEPSPEDNLIEAPTVARNAPDVGVGIDFQDLIPGVA